MNKPVYTKKDFMSDQTIRWCPGCGDYSILSQAQATFATLGVPRENFAIFAGIGCSGRFPYYVDTYGFHTIHGRAPAFASGLKATRPELSVWVITGDGDSLSIGGNHLIHAMRRNFDINILMFNNRIYGLTKGQYSPTSEVGKRTKSTPQGSIDAPFNPAQVALGAGCTFFARSVDVFPPHLRDTIAAAHAHKGTSLVEVLQNCNIFNDGAWTSVTDKPARDESVLYLEHGKPLVWGTEVRRGLVARGLGLAPVVLGVDADESDVVVHDTTDRNLAWALATLSGDGAPTVVGVFYQEERATYEEAFQNQARESIEKLGQGQLEKLVYGGGTWSVE